MGLNKSYKPSTCRNIGQNDGNGEEMVQLLGFFREFAKWTEMAIFLLGFEENTSKTTDDRGRNTGSLKKRYFLRHTATYPLHNGTLVYP